MAKMESREEMLKRLREKLQERSKNHRDPDQFIPPKARDKQKLEYVFRVLPPLQAGDTYKGGVCEKDQDLWFIENGNHWIDNTRMECPRVHDGEPCPICELGFSLMRDNEDDDYKQEVRKKYMPKTAYAVNAYFLNINQNPENLRGKVMWINLPITAWKIMNECTENDDGGTPEDPKPYGIFYHPYDGGYAFKLVVEKKGDWNNYERSQFLVQTFGPLIKDKNGKPEEARIQKILDQRHNLSSKFRPRDASKLQAIVDKLLRNQTGNGDAAVVENGADDVIQVEGVVKGGAKNVKPPVKENPKPKPSVEESVEEMVGTTVGTVEELVEETVEATSESTPPSKPTPPSPKKSDPKVTQKAKPTSPAKKEPVKETSFNEEDAEIQDILNKINGNE